MGISELSRQLKLPPGTLHRLLATLSRKGFVTQLFDGEYQLGHKVMESLLAIQNDQVGRLAVRAAG